MIKKVLSTSQKPQRIAWSSLIWAVLLLLAASKIAQLSLYFGRWPTPVRYLSFIMLVLMFWLIWLGLKRLFHWIKTLTIRRFVVGFIFIFFVIVMFVGLNNPSEEGPLKSFQNAAVLVPQTLGQWLSEGFISIVEYPSQIWTAYTGQSNANSLTNDSEASELVTANDDNISPIEIPVNLSADTSKLGLGDTVKISSRAPSLCRMAALSKGSLTEGALVKLLEGPRFMDGDWWWRVQSGQKIGWCPDKALGDF